MNILNFGEDSLIPMWRGVACVASNRENSKETVQSLDNACFTICDAVDI